MPLLFQLIKYATRKTMITLLINIHGRETKCRFSKKEITIGPDHTKNMDLPLPNSELKSPHVRLIRMGDQYMAHNCTDDPTVLLNGMPFKKRLLHANDHLSIQGLIIGIISIDASLSIEQGSESPLQKKTSRIFNASTLSKLVKEHSKKAIKGVLLLLPIALILTAWMFYHSKERYEEEEKIAARGLSDAAMAIVWAKQNNQSPLNQNWSNPKFIQKNLAAILPKRTFSYCEVDGQGKFQNCPYLLSVYSTDEYNRFLLVAQPESSWKDWGTTRKTYLVDTATLELRSADTIRPLNHLLLGKSIVSRANQGEINKFLYHTDLVPLSWLDDGEPAGRFSTGSETDAILTRAPRYEKLANSEEEIAMNDEISYEEPIYDSYQESGRRQLMEKITRKINHLLTDNISEANPNLHKEVLNALKEYEKADHSKPSESTAPSEEYYDEEIVFLSDQNVQGSHDFSQDLDRQPPGVSGEEFDAA